MGVMTWERTAMSHKATGRAHGWQHSENQVQQTAWLATARKPVRLLQSPASRALHLSAVMNLQEADHFNPKKLKGFSGT